MSDLVRKLSEGQHPVVVSLRPESNLTTLKEAIERGHVHIKFTNTLGGTELGIPINPERSDFSTADLDAGTGRFKISGVLSLDWVPVRCEADIDLPSLEGQGHLQRLADA